MSPRPLRARPQRPGWRTRILLTCLGASLWLGLHATRAPERSAAHILHGRPTAPQSERELSLATYNIWGLHRFWGRAPEQRYRLIGESLERAADDVVALQEVWCAAAQAALPRGAEWSVVRGSLEGQWGKQSGLVTATRHRVLEARSYHFRREAGASALLSSKGALYTAIELASGSVALVWNTHMQSGETRDAVRVEQVRELLGWIERERTDWGRRHPGGEAFVCVLGDFNCTFESEPFRLLQAGLARCGALRTSAGGSPTYDHLDNAWAVREAPKEIDYVCAAGRIAGTARAERIFDRRRARLGQRYLSDHFGVRMRWTRELAPPPTLHGSRTLAVAAFEPGANRAQ